MPENMIVNCNVRAPNRETILKSTINTVPTGIAKVPVPERKYLQLKKVQETLDTPILTITKVPYVGPIKAPSNVIFNVKKQQCKTISTLL